MGLTGAIGVANQACGRTRLTGSSSGWLPQLKHSYKAIFLEPSRCRAELTCRDVTPDSSVTASPDGGGAHETQHATRRPSRPGPVFGLNRPCEATKRDAQP